MSTPVAAQLLVAGLFFVVTSVIAMLVSEEARAQWARLCRWLVGRAVRSLPSHHRDRYEEEWFAELEAHPGGPLSHMWWALSILLSSRKIAVVTAELPEPHHEVVLIVSVNDAATAAAQVLERATRVADHLVDEALNEVRSRRARISNNRLIRRLTKRGEGAKAAPASGPTYKPGPGCGPGHPAWRLLEIASRNADELVESAAAEAARIRRET